MRPGWTGHASVFVTRWLRAPRNLIGPMLHLGPSRDQKLLKPSFGAVLICSNDQWVTV